MPRARPFPIPVGFRGQGPGQGTVWKQGGLGPTQTWAWCKGVLVRTVAQTWGAETPRASEVKVWQAGLQNKENLDSRGRRKGVQPRPGPQWAHLAPGSTIPGNTLPAFPFVS